MISVVTVLYTVPGSSPCALTNGYFLYIEQKGDPRNIIQNGIYTNVYTYIGLSLEINRREPESYNDTSTMDISISSMIPAALM